CRSHRHSFYGPLRSPGSAPSPRLRQPRLLADPGCLPGWFRLPFVRKASTSQPARDWCTSLDETCFCPWIFSPLFCRCGVLYVTSISDPPHLTSAAEAATKREGFGCRALSAVSFQRTAFRCLFL